MTKSIPISDAEEGMILAKDVTDEKGMTLCVKGTSITERIKSILKQRAIATIYIESDEEMSQEEYLTIKERIEKRFAAAGGPDSLLGKLKIAVLEHLEYKKG